MQSERNLEHFSLSEQSPLDLLTQPGGCYCIDINLLIAGLKVAWSVGSGFF